MQVAGDKEKYDASDKRAKSSLDPEMLQEMLKDTVKDPSEDTTWMSMESLQLISKYSKFLIRLSSSTDRLNKLPVLAGVKKQFSMSQDMADLWASQLSRAFARARRFRYDTSRLSNEACPDAAHTIKIIRSNAALRDPNFKRTSPSPSPSPPAVRPTKALGAEAESMWKEVLTQPGVKSEGSAAAEAESLWRDVLPQPEDEGLFADLFAGDSQNPEPPPKKMKRPVINTSYRDTS